MRKTLLISAGACLLLAAPAFANPIQINTGGGSPAQAQVYGDGSAASASRSTSVSHGGKATSSVVVNVAAPTAAPTNSGAHGSGAHHAAGHATKAPTDPAADPSGDPASGQRYHGGAYAHSSGSQRPVATAEAPAIASFNPCSGSQTSGAAQFAPFGISFGSGGGYDNSCRLHMLGQDKAAVAYLCRANSDIRQAFKDIGQPCPEDQPKVVAVAVSPPSPQEYRYDWCYTRDAGSAKQARECKASGR